MSRTAEQLVQQEVIHCASELVSTLAQGYGNTYKARNVDVLAAQAFELAAPIDDYESAARDAGWSVDEDGDYWRWLNPHNAKGDMEFSTCRTWESLCFDNDIEPHQLEVFEHWLVTDWLGYHLTDQGEKVDRNFAGLCIWARTTKTGQDIAQDNVIQQIVKKLNAEHED